MVGQVSGFPCNFIDCLIIKSVVKLLERIGIQDDWEPLFLTLDQ